MYATDTPATPYKREQNVSLFPVLVGLVVRGANLASISDSGGKSPLILKNTYKENMAMLSNKNLHINICMSFFY